MEAVWADMALTQLPSWVTKAPSDWGTAARGKLSANNWRVICTVHLPITLIRLWGGDDTPGNQNAMLENFMDLVRAVQNANLRSTSRKEIGLYNHHIYSYMTSFKSLYKDTKVKPIHHAALHYGDVLQGFGPAHTHSAAFYERHIHAMQSENHNMKLGSSFDYRSNLISNLSQFQPGELELTFMHSSAREANLHSLLEDDSEVRSHVSDLVRVYKSILAEDVRGMRLAHMIDAVRFTQQTADIAYDGNSLRESNLPDAILVVFRQFLRCKYPKLRDKDAADDSSVSSPKAKVLDRLSLRSVQYSTASRRARDSHVFFRPQSRSETSPSPEPGQIIHIFLDPYDRNHAPRCSDQRNHTSVYVCVQPYASLQTSPESELSNIDQRYRRFGFGFLYRSEFSLPIIVEPSSIISHVAITPLEICGHKVLHILPMDRVRL
jgi:hypothetical protein